MDPKDYFKMIKKRPSPWAVDHGLTPSLISRLLNGKPINIQNALKIVKATGGRIRLKDIYPMGG